MVDKNEGQLSHFNGQDIPLHVCDAELLENINELEIRSEDYCLVLMSSNIGASVLVAQNLVEKKIDVNHIFVRVINSQHRKILQSLGITKFIDPDQMVARKIIMDISKQIDITYFDSKNYIFKLKNEKIDNVLISDLLQLKKYQINILLIFRASNDPQSVIYPSGNTRLQLNDRILLLVNKEQIDQINSIFGNQ